MRSNSLRPVWTITALSVLVALLSTGCPSMGGGASNPGKITGTGTGGKGSTPGTNAQASAEAMPETDPNE